jgi:biopolymer transport protein ExbD
MAFGGFTQNQTHQPVAEINMIPLIDVMLVLLVIFIVTAPLLTHAVRIDLPQAAAQPAPQKPETIALALDGDGRVHWNREAVTLDALRPRLVQAAAQQPQPELHLHADKNTRYQQLAEVMAAVQNAGLQKLGFITTPNELRK